MTEAPEITAKSWLMIVILGITWGGTFLVTKMALDGISPFWLAASRICLGAVVTIGIWRGMGGRLFYEPASGAQWLNLAVIAALSAAVPFGLLAWGQQFVSSGFAGVSMASVALIVLPLAHFLVPGERITLRRAVGFMIGFAGVVILIGGQAFESSGSALEFPGRLACLGAAACYAVSSVLMRRLPPVDPVGLSTMLLLFGVVYIVPLAWITEGPPPALDMRTLGLVALLGLVPTAAANLLRVMVVRTAGPVFLSLVNYQVPVWSVVMGAIFLGEALTMSLLWAMLLILAGVGLSQYGALKRLFLRAA